MSTSTPRLILTKPDPPESMALGDDALRGNYDKIDQAIADQSVNALTDITAPYQGQLTYHWNVAKESRVYNGTKWDHIGDQSDGHGRVGEGVRDTRLDITPADGTVFVTEANFDGIVGRSFLVRWRVSSRYFEADADWQTFEVKFTSKAAPRTASYDPAFEVRVQKIDQETTVTLSDAELIIQHTGFFEVTTGDGPWNLSMWIDNIDTSNTRLEVCRLSGDFSAVQVEDWSD